MPKKKKTETEPPVPTATSDGIRMPTILAMCREEITRKILDHAREIGHICGISSRPRAEAGTILPYVLTQILFETSKPPDPYPAFKANPRENFVGFTEDDYRAEGRRVGLQSRLWDDKPEAGFPELVRCAIAYVELDWYDEKFGYTARYGFDGTGVHGLFKARIAEHVKANAGFIANAVEAAIPGAIAHTDGDAAVADLIRASLFDARPRPNPLAPDRMRNVHRGIPEYIKERMSAKLWLDMPEAAPSDIIRNAVLALDPADSADRFPLPGVGGTRPNP